MQRVLERLTEAYPDLSPRLRQAAKFVLDHPNEVAINSMRQLAAAADVAPSTMLRLAKAIDFDNYEDFRQPFRDTARGREKGFSSRARWLQEISAGGDDEKLLGSMAAAHFGNLESVFRDNDLRTFSRAAEIIRQAEKVYIIGVGGGYGLAHYFHYVAKMAFSRLRFPAGQTGSLLDDLIDVSPNDVAIAITFDPYTAVTVRAAEFIREKGARLISITDSRASPLASGADAVLLAPTASPLFFPSYTSATAVAETLITFVVSGASAETVKQIADMERLRHAGGIYWNPASAD